MIARRACRGRRAKRYAGVQPSDCKRRMKNEMKAKMKKSNTPRARAVAYSHRNVFHGSVG